MSNVLINGLSTVTLTIASATLVSGGSNTGAQLEGRVVPFPPSLESSQVPNYSRSVPEEASAARPIHVISEPGQSWSINGMPRTEIEHNVSGAVVPFGEMHSAYLLYGFNSDNPTGMPIFAEMGDIEDNGREGPLHGAVLRGGVSYSEYDASIIFSTARLANGKEIDIEAIAVSGRSGTTGVAEKVNKHTFQRYGSLFLAGLIEGIGDVAQARLTNDDESGTVIVIGDDATLTSDNDEPSNGEVLAGALQPVGENLSSAAESNFNREATISAEMGMRFAVVFTKSITAEDLMGAE